ncbi:MAG: hypothetical protein ACRDV8_13805, partial [Acidimicrobiales bacterium]
PAEASSALWFIRAADDAPVITWRHPESARDPGGRCRTLLLGATLAAVPTTRPRYTFTDTGDLEELLDAAQRRWPEVTDRKELLLRLAEAGGGALGLERGALVIEERRARAQAALKRLPSLVDAEVLLSDQAWR